MNQKEVLVLGAGVSGLSTGILLLKAGYQVQIWAKDLPPNTTSNIAAAFWYPFLAEPKAKVTEWSSFTLQYLRQNLLADPTSGCVSRSVTEIFAKPGKIPWWQTETTQLRQLNPDDLPPGYGGGYQSESVLMDTSIYMTWLLEQYKQLGGRTQQRTVKDINEALAEFETVINCIGLGSRELFNDDQIFPVRGQVVLVKPNGFKEVMADENPDNLVYIIPRINDIVLGGTYQINDWNLEVDPQDTEDILRKARALSPAFNEAEIIGIKVGLRPARPAVRLEVEKFGDKHVVHNYGHGGSGFTLSWGCANDVVELVKGLH